MKAVIDPADAKSVGITVKADDSGKGSDFTYDVEKQTISGLAKDKGKAGLAGTFTGPLKAADDGSLSVDIYIDRSLVEAYFNTARSISLRSYSDFEDRGIHFNADGKITIKELHLATMKSIF